MLQLNSSTCSPKTRSRIRSLAMPFWTAKCQSWPPAPVKTSVTLSCGLQQHIQAEGRCELVERIVAIAATYHQAGVLGQRSTGNRSDVLSHAPFKQGNRRRFQMSCPFHRFRVKCRFTYSGEIRQRRRGKKVAGKDSFVQCTDRTRSRGPKPAGAGHELRQVVKEKGLPFSAAD